jgi:hypothetical protein
MAALFKKVRRSIVSILLSRETVSKYEKPALPNGGEAVRWKRFSAETFSRSDSGVPIG